MFLQSLDAVLSKGLASYRKEVASLDERLLDFSNFYFLSTHGSVDRSAFSNVLNLARFIFQIIFAAGIELQLPSCNLF